MFDKIGFLLSEAFTALRRNGLMTFAAVSTVAVSMFMLGGLGYVYYRTMQYAEILPGRFEMRVFLREGTTKRIVEDVAPRIRAIPGVKAATWMPSDKVWEREKLSAPDLTEGIENPYPEGFKVIIEDLASYDLVAMKLRDMPEVDPDGITYLQQEQRLVDQILRLIRWLGGFLGGLLFLTGGILIYNAIRLTVLSRRLEIRIMQLVGASRLTVQVPFLIEGIVQGAAGGFVAFLLLSTGQALVLNFLRTLDALSAPPQFPFLLAAGVMTGAGAVYGLLCSSFAVREPLRYR